LKKHLALAALALVLLLGAAQSSNSVPDQLKAIQSQLNALRPRQFYLTKTTHTGAQALSACAAGYHMASMWEIREPTNLRYNTELGFTREDSGFGPPESDLAWIRTGSGAVSGNVAGAANCNAWTSASVQDIGTGAFLVPNWAVPPAGSPLSVVSPFAAGQVLCDAPLQVWCVQD